jgi:hypothetical protein
MAAKKKAKAAPKKSLKGSKKPAEAKLITQPPAPPKI